MPDGEFGFIFVVGTGQAFSLGRAVARASRFSRSFWSIDPIKMIVKTLSLLLKNMKDTQVEAHIQTLRIYEPDIIAFGVKDSIRQPERVVQTLEL